MSLIALGEEIRWIKETFLTRIEKEGLLPVQKNNGNWISVLSPGQILNIGSNHFGNTSKRLPASLNRKVHVDAFPVSVSDYLEFIGSGAYFDEDYWPSYRIVSRHRGGDEVIRNILQATGYACEWPMMQHVPVTNVTWYEAFAYARWKKKQLLNEMVWEYAATGSRNMIRTQSILYKFRRSLSREQREKATHSLDTFSDFGCWGMLGGIIEWCGDRFVHNAYFRHKNGTLNLYHEQELQSTSYVNVRGFARGDFRSMQPENIANRRALKPLEANHRTGFRCCEIVY